ncbi:MAG: hypothetical protein JO149_05560 [Gammaproteobacteria bacterium]|nr:hypothetical protein [Gammaproteobacteria bacterium]
MKKKINFYKKLLVSYLLFFMNLSYSDTISNLIGIWKKNDNYLIFAVPVKIDKLNPTISLNAHTKLTLPLIFEPLVTIDAQQNLQPILAKSWHPTSDGKSIIVNIKSLHFFSDNTEVTAQDILNSINQVCSPGSEVSEELSGLNNCVSHANGNRDLPSMKILSKYEIEFDINCNPTAFLYQLSSPSNVITKKTIYGLIGSGPYVLNENKSIYAILKKNNFASKDNFARNAGIILFYANQKNIPHLFNVNKFDGALMYRIDDIWNFSDSNYNVFKINPNITEIFVLNNQRFPFNKSIVRQALSAALYNNFQQNCIPGSHKAYGIIPYGTGGSIANMPPDSLTEVLPQQVFEKVPELKNKKVNITIHQLYDLKRDCESKQIQNAAKAYNIDIKFQYHQSYPPLESLYLNHHLDGFVELYVFKNREAFSVIQFFTKNGENNANIADKILDTKLKEAIAASSSHRRFQRYREISKYIQDKSIVIPLLYMDHGNILNKCIKGTSDNFLFNSFSYLPQLYRSNCK